MFLGVALARPGVCARRERAMDYARYAPPLGMFWIGNRRVGCPDGVVELCKTAKCFPLIWYDNAPGGRGRGL